MNPRRTRIDWGLVAFVVAFFICVGLMLVNAELWSAHPHHRGLNLFAAIWCGVIALYLLFQFGRYRSYR